MLATPVVSPARGPLAVRPWLTSCRLVELPLFQEIPILGKATPVVLLPGVLAVSSLILCDILSSGLPGLSEDPVPGVATPVASAASTLCPVSSVIPVTSCPAADLRLEEAPSWDLMVSATSSLRYIVQVACQVGLVSGEKMQDHENKYFFLLSGYPGVKRPLPFPEITG